MGRGARLFRLAAPRSGSEVATVHDNRDVLFGGHAPEPDDHLLEDLRDKMHETSASIGIATDGDADRFGIVDGDGTFIQPNYVIALLFDYLVESRGWKNGVAKSVATTNLINALAKPTACRCTKLPWDSNTSASSSCRTKSRSAAKRAPAFPSAIMFRKKTECSPDSSAARWSPDAASLWASNCGRSCNQVGSYYPRRENFRLTPEVKAKFTEKLRSDPKKFSGHAIHQVVRTDGLKLVFNDGSWVCYRLSGTEPVVRVYSEARSEADIEKLSAAAKQWIFD